MFEALIISFLSYWLYEESLANPYLSIYVNQMVQTEGAAIGIFVLVIVLLGGVTGMLFLRGKNGGKSSTPIPTVTKTPRPETPKPEPAPAATNSGPTKDLHPVVAALKAELSGNPMPFGAESLAVTLPKRDEGEAWPSNHAAVSPPRSLAVGPGSVRPSTVIVGAMPVFTKAEPRELALRPSEGERATAMPISTAPMIQRPPVAETEQPQKPVLKKAEPEKKQPPEST